MAQTATKNAGRSDAEYPAGATRAQVQYIAGMASRIFPEDTFYRDWLSETFPDKSDPNAPMRIIRWSDQSRPSTTDLSRAEADRAIKLLQPKDPFSNEKKEDPAHGMGHWKGRYSSTGRDGFATQNQLNEIAKLEDEIGMDSLDRLKGFIEKVLGKPLIPRVLRRNQASVIITGLRRWSPQRPEKHPRAR